MQKSHLYTKNESGIVSYRGAEAWPTANYAIQFYNPCGVPAPVTEALIGWPHESVQWFGNVGLAGQSFLQPGHFAPWRKPVCPSCKSESISMDAQATWADGEWHLDTIHSDGACGDCEATFKEPHWQD